LLSFFFIIVVVVKVVFVCTPQRALLLAMLQEERREEGDVNVAIAFVDRCFVGFLMLLLFALGVILRVLNIDDVVGDTLLVADIIIFLLSQKLLLYVLFLFLLLLLFFKIALRRRGCFLGESFFLSSFDG
jgi:hypothetical protein